MLQRAKLERCFAEPEGANSARSTNRVLCERTANMI